MTEEQQLEQLREIIMKGLGLTEDDIRVIKARTEEENQEQTYDHFTPYMYRFREAYEADFLALEKRLEEGYQADHNSPPVITFTIPAGVKQL